MSEITLTKEEATQLYHYLRFQYISHEKYPRVHEIMQKLQDAERSEHEGEDNNQESSHNQ